MITKPARGRHDLRPTNARGTRSEDRDLRIDLSEEEAPPRGSRPRENSLRLLARWLVAAARTGAGVSGSASRDASAPRQVSCSVSVVSVRNLESKSRISKEEAT